MCILFSFAIASSNRIPWTLDAVENESGKIVCAAHDAYVFKKVVQTAPPLGGA
jgi:hypothetical protein